MFLAKVVQMNPTLCCKTCFAVNPCRFNVCYSESWCFMPVCKAVFAIYCSDQLKGCFLHHGHTSVCCYCICDYYGVCDQVVRGLAKTNACYSEVWFVQHRCSVTLLSCSLKQFVELLLTLESHFHC